jgi:hypothetical protein
MAAIRDKFTAGNDGNALSASNSDADTVVVTGGTLAIDTAVVYSPTRSVLATATSTSGGAYWTRNINATSALATDMYIRYTTLPSAEMAVTHYMSTTTQSVRLNILDTGQVRLRDGAAGGGANIWTSTASMTTGTWYRISMYATQNATTGTVRVAFYAGGSGTALDDSTLLTGRNTGASPYTAVRWGVKTSTGTTTAVANIDDYAYDDAATGLLPVESVDPVIQQPPYLTQYYVFVDLSGSTAGTGPIEYSAIPSAGVLDDADGLYLPVNADGSATNYTLTATDTGAAGSPTDSIPYTAQLPADIIETVKWSGSAWV